jgi:phosphonate transport system ATP-binding protein
VNHSALSFSLTEVSLDFDGPAVLEGLSFRIEPGEIVALVGPSGAGKTSVLRMLNGSLPSAEGSVLVQDQDLKTLPTAGLRELRSQIGFVPQSFGLIPNLRVIQNVIAGRIARMGTLGALRAMLHQRAAELDEVHELLESLGIEEKLFQRVDSLSGGEQQRVAIARALYQSPGALLADEPLSALDPARARETLLILVQLARSQGLTLVLSLHDIGLAREMIPRLIGLRDGRIQFDRVTSEIEDHEIEALYGLKPSLGLHEE